MSPELENHYLAVYDLVFTETHSRGFKIAEAKDVVTEADYTFLERPTEGWKERIEEYNEANGLGWDLTHLMRFDT